MNSKRMISLDILRGIAVLGIIFMNIQGFSMPISAYLNPTAFGDLNGANFASWLVLHTFIDGKFISLFSLLFGVGLCIFYQACVDKGWTPWRVTYRRLFLLLLLGLLHAYLVWFGDILFTYAVTGLLVLGLVKAKVSTLYIVSVLMLLIPSVIRGSLLLGYDYMSEQDIREIAAFWQPSVDMLAAEISAYQGSYGTQLAQRFEHAFYLQTAGFLQESFWRVGGIMLLGMALYKQGFFSGELSPRRYAVIAMACGLLGFTLILLGINYNLNQQFDMQYSMSIGFQFNYWGSVLVALCYASVVMIWVYYCEPSRLKDALAAVGKMALTNYLMQSVICAMLFYGIGLYAEIERLELLALALAIGLAQLQLSSRFLARHGSGPIERVWRKATYAGLQPVSHSEQGR